MLQNEPNFMLVRYSIVELLMVFEVSAQREHTIIKFLEKIPGIVVRFSKNGWMNDALTVEYLNCLIGAFSFHKRLLVWDAYKCHISEHVRAHIKSLHLHSAVVPGSCTKFIQAADVVWNASFKRAMRSHYDTWLTQPANFEYTQGGNVKPPSRTLLCDWVKSSWESVSVEMIKNSFKSCAITTSTDGSEDDKIHCFQPSQPCSEGRTLLEQETAELSRPQTVITDMDPFESDEDDDETNANEIVVDSDIGSSGEDDGDSEQESDEASDESDSS